MEIFVQDNFYTVGQLVKSFLRWFIGLADTEKKITVN